MIVLDNKNIKIMKYVSIKKKIECRKSWIPYMPFHLHDNLAFNKNVNIFKTGSKSLEEHEDN